MNLQEISRMDEDQAREYFENLRWPTGPKCPHCGSIKITRLTGGAHRSGAIQCNDCLNLYHQAPQNFPKPASLPQGPVVGVKYFYG